MPHHKKFDPKERSYYWWAIMYLENMREDWKEIISAELQVPFAYCIHNKDHAYTDGSERKPHVHILIALDNNYNGNYARKLFYGLNADGKNALPNNEIEKVNKISYAYNYLIHDTDDARSKGKFQYPKSDRIVGNNFDIGMYEQLNSTQVDCISSKLCDIICEKSFTNFTQFYKFVRNDIFFEGERDDYITVVKRQSGLFERLCRGNYLDHAAIVQEKKDSAYMDSMQMRSEYYKKKISNPDLASWGYHADTTTKGMETKDERKK